MQKVNGKQIANHIKEEIRELLKTSGSKSLAIFYVGENPVIDSYVGLKKRVGEELGITVDVIRFPDDTSEQFLIDQIHNANEQYSGIIVQLPLPGTFDKERVLNAVRADLDVDVLSRQAYEQFTTGKTAKLPPVVGAFKEIIDAHQIDLTNKNIVIVGKGVLVGKPVSAYLSREGFASTLIDRDNDLKSALIDADIIISGAGVPALVTPDMVKVGAVLIDAGTSTSSGKLMGDIDRACYDKASLVSPVPGGVGPITVVNLFKNLFLS